MKRFALMLFAALVLGGCNTIERTNRFEFVDDDGGLISVEYGVSRKDHVTKFVSPFNGQETTLVTRLHVNVRLPDGRKFSGWQMMNTLGAGTMYISDDKEWQLCVTGMNANVFYRVGETNDYLWVFAGTLTGVPKK